MKYRTFANFKFRSVDPVKASSRYFSGSALKSAYVIEQYRVFILIARSGSRWVGHLNIGDYDNCHVQWSARSGSALVRDIIHYIQNVYPYQPAGTV